MNLRSTDGFGFNQIDVTLIESKGHQNIFEGLQMDLVLSRLTY